MKIVINNNRKIFAIQEEFSALLPGLKIIFYARPSRHGAAASPKLVLHPGKTLRECRDNPTEGVLNVIPTMNIRELKDSFRNVFGLTIEVVHKNKNGGDEPIPDDKQVLGVLNRQFSV